MQHNTAPAWGQHRSHLKATSSLGHLRVHLYVFYFSENKCSMLSHVTTQTLCVPCSVSSENHVQIFLYLLALLTPQL